MSRKRIHCAAWLRSLLVWLSGHVCWACLFWQVLKPFCSAAFVLSVTVAESHAGQWPLVSLGLPLALWKSWRALVRGLPCSGVKVKPLHKGDKVMRHQKPVTSYPFCKWLSLLFGLLYFCPYLLFRDDTVGELMVWFFFYMCCLLCMRCCRALLLACLVPRISFWSQQEILEDCIMKICSTSVWYDLIYCRSMVNGRPPWL